MRAELPFSLNSRQLHRANQHLIIRACLQGLTRFYWPSPIMVILTAKCPHMSALSYQAQRFGETFRYEGLHL
jgi:hypothetical protein